MAVVTVAVKIFQEGCVGGTDKTIVVLADKACPAQVWLGGVKGGQCPDHIQKFIVVFRKNCLMSCIKVFYRIVFQQQYAVLVQGIEF